MRRSRLVVAHLAFVDSFPLLLLLPLLCLLRLVGGYACLRWVGATMVFCNVVSLLGLPGVQFLHVKKIVHGNLKSTNVMVFENNRMK